MKYEHMGTIPTMSDSGLIKDKAMQDISIVYNNPKPTINNIIVTNNTEAKELATDNIVSTKNKVVQINSNLYVSKQFCMDGDVCITGPDIINMGRTSIGYRPSYPDSQGFPFMYSSSPSSFIIYDDVINARDLGVFSAFGVSQLQEISNAQFGYRMIDIGTSNGESGIEITVPNGMFVLWLRVPNNMWSTFKIAGDGYLRYTCGFRNIIKLRPDGMDDVDTLHRWVPYPVPKAGKYKLSGMNNNNTDYLWNLLPINAVWISGIGFSANYNNHAMLSAVTYYLSSRVPEYNPGYNNNGINFWPNNWPSDKVTDNTDNLAYITKQSSGTVTVPIVPTQSGDKMLYILNTGRDNDNAYISECILKVNGTQIENFRRYDNAFSRYYNSKKYITYFGARIPRSVGDKVLIDTTQTTITVEINTSSNMITDHLYFREIGTHDY